MNKPEISVITVCFNSEKTIERTLQAILSQSFKDYEYLIIDGASTDGTMSIVRKYEPLFEGRMKVYSEPDKGIYDAMNKGIGKAQGNIVGIVNSDDYYEDDTLMMVHDKYQEIVESGVTNNHFILYGMLRILKKGEEVQIEFNHDRTIGDSMIYHPSCFVSKAVYDDYEVYNTQYSSAADLEFLIRIKKNTDTLFFPIYEVLSNFELGGMSSSGKGTREAAEVRYRYGIYSKSRRNYCIAQSRLVDIVHWLKRKK